jgi:hypothetical protein
MRLLIATGRCGKKTLHQSLTPSDLAFDTPGAEFHRKSTGTLNS